MTNSPPVAAAPAATLGRRVGAFAIDVAIASVIAALAAGILVGVVFAVAPLRDPDALALVAAAVWAGVSVLMLAWWLVYSAMQGGRGSIGQRALGIRLHDAATGTAVGFGRALWRNIVFGLAAQILIGYFTPLFDTSGRHQGWHDRAARAVVIDGRRQDAAPHAHAPAAGYAAPAPLPLYGAPVQHVAAPSEYAAAAQLAPVQVAAAHAAPFPAAPAQVAPAHVAPVMYAPPAGYVQPARYVHPAPPAPPAHYAAVAPTAPVTVPPTAALATVAQPAMALAGAAVGAPVHAAPAAAPFANAEDVAETRAAAPRTAARPGLPAESPVIAVLTWDDGTRMAVYGPTLYGRNPAGEPGIAPVAVRDETLSMSKTHFEVGGDAAGAWIVDRHSTNGTTLVRDGGRIPLFAGVRATLRSGDVLELGDRRATVGLAQ